MTTPPEPQNPPPPPPADTGLGERVGRLEAGQQTILGRLDQLLAGSPRQPQAAPENPAVAIQEEIRRQLAAQASPAPPAPAGPPPPETPPVAQARKVSKAIWGSDL